MKRRILLVDDEVAVLLTMKAVLEISGFEVETAASAREGKLRLRSHEYHMIITDMRMENDEAGREVIRAARTASYRPAVALLTAFPVEESDWQELGADQLLLKPMHTRILLDQIEQLLAAREQRLASPSTGVAVKSPFATKKTASRKAAPAKKTAEKKTLRSITKTSAKKIAEKKNAAKKSAPATKKAMKQAKSVPAKKAKNSGPTKKTANKK